MASIDLLFDWSPEFHVDRVAFYLALWPSSKQIDQHVGSVVAGGQLGSYLRDTVNNKIQQLNSLLNYTFLFGCSTQVQITV